VSITKKQKKTNVLGIKVTLKEALKHTIANYEEALECLEKSGVNVNYNSYGRYRNYAREYAKAAQRLIKRVK